VILKLNSMIFLDKTPTKALNAMCKKDTSCEIFHWLPENDQTRIDHILNVRHTCKWGWDCKIRLRDNVHSRDYIHVQLPKCAQDEMCGEMEDQVHRSQYSHTGMWAFLVPCKKFHTTKNCNNCDPTKYYH